MKTQNKSYWAGFTSGLLTGVMLGIVIGAVSVIVRIWLYGVLL